MNYGYYSPQYPGIAQQAAYNQPTQNGLVWVQGESGAKSYLMAPNSTALLMDSEASRMYIKATDATGMPTLRIFEYTEVTQTKPAEPIDYPTKAEFDELKAKVEEMLTKNTKGAKSNTQSEKEA